MILTPYLGQLDQIWKELGRDFDPQIIERDSSDLAKAGIHVRIATKRSEKSAKIKLKPRIHVSTIDNYQGEESDIVIASFTRSNTNGQIGFMSSPERLNVLLSRTRNALIMIGNASTFENARGADFWKQLLQHLEEGKHIYQGFPVKCERHPENTALLRTPLDFAKHCPDGGCTEPCDVYLSCGVHKCPLKCHHQDDHSDIKCTAIVENKCARGKHDQRSPCHEGEKHEPCSLCELEDQEKKRRERDASSDETGPKPNTRIKRQRKKKEETQHRDSEAATAERNRKTDMRVDVPANSSSDGAFNKKESVSTEESTKDTTQQTNDASTAGTDTTVPSSSDKGDTTLP